MNYIYLIYTLFFGVVGFIAYHKMFEVTYFSLGRGLFKEIIGCFIFGLIMTAITMMLWGLSVIVIIFVGIVMAGKAKTPSGKIMVLLFFVFLAIITMVAGINIKKETKDAKNGNSSKNIDYIEEYEEEYCDYFNVDSGNI